MLNPTQIAQIGTLHTLPFSFDNVKEMQIVVSDDPVTFYNIRFDSEDGPGYTIHRNTDDSTWILDSYSEVIQVLNELV